LLCKLTTCPLLRRYSASSCALCVRDAHECTLQGRTHARRSGYLSTSHTANTGKCVRCSGMYKSVIGASLICHRGTDCTVLRRDKCTGGSCPQRGILSRPPAASRGRAIRNTSFGASYVYRGPKCCDDGLEDAWQRSEIWGACDCWGSPVFMLPRVASCCKFLVSSIVSDLWMYASTFMISNISVATRAFVVIPPICVCPWCRPVRMESMRPMCVQLYMFRGCSSTNRPHKQQKLVSSVACVL